VFLVTTDRPWLWWKYALIVLLLTIALRASPLAFLLMHATVKAKPAK
jgi:hypothetical protein